MDRRLSGALAWGALLLIVGIPGLDMLSRGDGETAGAATAPADANGALSWQSGSSETEATTFGPLPPSATTDAPDAGEDGEDDSLPEVTLLASAPETPASDSLPAAPSPSIITLDTGTDMPAPAQIDTRDVGAVIADVATSPAAEPETEPELTDTEDLDTANEDTVSSVIAARVRDVLLSSPDAADVPEATSMPVASADLDLGSAASPPSGETTGAVADDDLAAVATAPLDFSTPLSVRPETIPYPAPALRRVSRTVARTTFVPPEPVPEIRPDNAIFFSDWVNTPPKTAATGPGRQ